MKRKRSEQIPVYVAPVLKAEVEAAAAEEGRTVSDYVRRILIDHAVARSARAVEKAA